MPIRFFSNCTALFVIWLTVSLATLQNPTSANESGMPNGESVEIKALIIDGQNNHNAWPKSTMMMKSQLEESGKFSVDIYRTKYTWNGGRYGKEFPLNDGKTYEDLPKAKADPDFKPDFAKYDVVISNFGHGAADWPESTQQAFVKFINDGGGFVSIHAADNSFPNWKQYNEIIGLGGWGGRSEKSGPYVYYNDEGKIVRDTSKGGGGGHGPQHEFSVVIRDSDHPITKGLPTEFMHTKDELYERLRGPGLNMEILATAFASPDKKGSGRHEPMIMTINYGDGRVFHTPMGHADYSFECVGFITVFLRGTEWAASGKVTLPVPDDFPTADQSKSRKYDAPKSAAGKQ